MATNSEQDLANRTLFGGLIEFFGAGWMECDPKKMAEVFAEDGVFVPGPFEKPIAGRAAIAAYWDTLPYEQSDVAFRFGEIYLRGPWFATEFKCTFRRRRTGVPVDVRGTVFCETRDGRITEMRMYWDRRAGG